MTETRDGRHRVVTLIVYVHLTVVSVTVELHIVSINHISKVRHEEDEKFTVESAIRRLHRWHHVVAVQKRLDPTLNDPLQKLGKER